MSTDKPNPEDGEAILPAGVSVAHVGSDGEILYVLDSFMRDMRWEGVQVDSSAFKALSISERFYRQSSAFLQAAIVLCEDAGETGSDLEWPQASVCYYCLHLATELFLKACIVHVDKHPKELNHEIADLLRRYRELLPGQEFNFNTPWFASASDVNQMLRHDVLQGVDRTPDQLFRYGMDKNMTTSAGVQMFTPGYLLNYMTQTKNRWSEIWSNVTSASNA